MDEFLQKNLEERVFSLIINRVLHRIYSGLSESQRSEIEKVFEGDSDKEKQKFMKANVPNFKEIFEEEAKNVETDIKAGIEKEV